eukprot:COSAG05_NODE_1982_length_3748_cov_1.987942_1_plen_1054_part_10
MRRIRGIRKRATHTDLFLELRQKYLVERDRAQEVYEEAREAAAGAAESQGRLAIARERLRALEIFKHKKPTDAQVTAAEAALDGEICEASRAIEGMRLPRASYKHAKKKLVHCIGALSVLGHARAVRAAKWKPEHLVQRLTLDVSTSQFPSSAVAATVTYSQARAVLKRELMEALSTVCALHGCQHAYRVAKRRMLYSKGALEHINFLRHLALIEVRGAIKMVEGGVKADMDDAEKALGEDSIEEHETLKKTQERWWVSKGTLDFLRGIVLGGLGGFAPEVRSAAEAKARQRKQEYAKAMELLGLRKPAKEKARQIEGKLVVMACVRDISAQLFDCQDELRRLVTQDHGPLADMPYFAADESNSDSRAPSPLTNSVLPKQRQVETDPIKLAGHKEVFSLFAEGADTVETSKLGAVLRALLLAPTEAELADMQTKMGTTFSLGALEECIADAVMLQSGSEKLPKPTQQQGQSKKRRPSPPVLMTAEERAEKESVLSKRIDIAWDVWQEALQQLHNMHEQQKRIAAYEMESLEVQRVQLRKAKQWLHTVRGRLVALNLVSRPRGGVVAFLKHKKVELQIEAMLATSSQFAAESDCRDHRTAQLKLQAIRETSVFLSYMKQVRQDVSLGAGPEKARWRPAAQMRAQEDAQRAARLALPKLWGRVHERTIAKRRYHLAKGAVEWFAKPENSLRALQLVNPLVEDARKESVECELKVSEAALKPAIEAAQGAKELKQQLWTARQKLAILDVLMTAEHSAVADYVPEDQAERALAVAHGTSNGRPVSWHPFVNPRGLKPEQELDEVGRFAAAAAAAELVLRNERWLTELLLKGTNEAARWHKKAKLQGLQAKGAVALVTKLIDDVTVPDDIEDDIEDVLRLSILVLGEAGAGKGARELVLPIRATAEMLLVKLVEKNWPELDAEIKVKLQLVFKGRTIPSADALVEHEIVSGDRLHLLLPQGAELPPEVELMHQNGTSTTGFTDGTAEGLATSIQTLKLRLSDLASAIAEGQWASTRAIVVDRETCWIDGARECLSSLRELLEDSGAGVPRDLVKEAEDR